ncbi:MAG: type II secretion system F family protein [Phenylobacterium sp.]
MPIFIDLLLDVLTFGAVFLLVLAAERALGASLAVRRRLVSDAVAPVARRDSVIKSDTVRNRFLVWVQSATLTDSKDHNKLRRDLSQAGFDHPAAPAIYVAVRLALAIGPPVGLIMWGSITGHPLTGLRAIVFPLALCGLGLLAPRYAIDNLANSRRTQMEQEFPDALDLMVVCVEAGLGLESAVVRVSDEVRESHPRIASEFGRLSDEMGAGRGRADALRAMADRVNVDTIKSFVALLIQTEALGVSIAQSLRTYSVEMREHRFLKAEEKAMRIPVLMTVPLVACFMPVIIVALLLPPAIDVVRTLMPALQGRH